MDKFPHSEHQYCKQGVVLKKVSVLLFVTALLFMVLISCNNSSNSDSSVSAELESGSGFITIPSVEYGLNANLFNNVRSSPVSIFYTFQVADRPDADDSPVFVFFNGGPGAATSSNLLSMNTTDRTLCKLVTGDNPDAPNPYSWRKLGNLLYIDAPGTGFSYTHSIFEDPCGNDGRRKHEYIHGLNYNPYIDADLMVRAMLEALAVNNVQGNKVILVGESYGGTRTTLMLNMILFYNNYGEPSDNQVFWDKALPGIVRKHLNEINGNTRKDFTPSEIADLQFGQHIMIQPQLTGWRQTLIAGEMLEKKGSVIYELAEKYHKDPYIPCSESHVKTCFIPLMGGPYLNVLDYVTETLELDPYNFQERKGWTDALEEHTTKSLNSIEVLRRLLGYDPELIIPMYSTYRRNCNAFKYLNTPSSLPDLASAFDSYIPAYAKVTAKSRTVKATPDTSDLAATFGDLESCDAYVKTWDAEQCYAYYMNDAWLNIFFQFYTDWKKIGKFRIDPESDEFGRMFLYNLTVMDVMITNAVYDFMVYSPSVPPSFEGYSEVERVVVDEDLKRFTVYYDQSKPLKDAPPTIERSIYHPLYDASGHAVSISQPELLRADVASFLGIDF